jgi:hypothetical protein
MVKIFGEKGFLGTGVLIDERRVLSVAHLFPDKQDFSQNFKRLYSNNLDVFVYI